MKIISILKKIKHFIIRPKKPIIFRKINGQNNTITFNTNSLSNVIFDICGDNNTILIPDSCKISNTKFFIQGNNNLIKLGENICINGGSLWQEDNFTSIVIGNKTTFENIHLAATEDYSKIVIGNDCMFAYDIEVRTGDSHSIIDKNTKTRLNKAANVVIGNHVRVLVIFLLCRLDDKGVGADTRRRQDEVEIRHLQRHTAEVNSQHQQHAEKHNNRSHPVGDIQALVVEDDRGQIYHEHVSLQKRGTRTQRAARVTEICEQVKQKAEHADQHKDQHGFPLM